MAYLDLTPMLQAMRARPSEFEMYGPFLRHIRSQRSGSHDRSTMHFRGLKLHAT
jgi:hypothetical protein